MYPIYKEMHVVGYFGGKMMYLDANGWRGMPCTKDVFNMENWMVFFSEYHGCKKLITFDKGFKKLGDITDVEVVVL